MGDKKMTRKGEKKMRMIIDMVNVMETKVMNE